jgi:hypothetical protein
VQDWIGQLGKEDGLRVILTTHHPHHALALADRALLMWGSVRYLVASTRNILIEHCPKQRGVAMWRAMHYNSNHCTLRGNSALCRSSLAACSATRSGTIFPLDTSCRSVGVLI